MKNNVVSKFEATMIACRKSKLNENKVTNKKKVTESAKKIKKESEELLDPELEELEDINDMELEDPEAEVEGVTDEIIVVTDPELDPEEVEEGIEELQDIVDETPEGEVPTMDDYVDDLVYTCPICGNNFFSEEELIEGDVCPVCGEVPDAFILVGDVQDPDEVIAEEEVEGEETPEEVPAEETPEEDEELEVAEECKVRMAKKENKKQRDIYLDESTFNPLLTQFITENYKNAEKMTLESAKLVGSNLKLECKITYKSGKTKATTITVENFKKSSNLEMNGKLDSAFKTESSNKSHLTVSGKMIVDSKKKAIVVKAEKLNYDFTSKVENARYQVSGSHKIVG